MAGSNAAALTLGGAQPILRVSDIAASVKYYVEALGFKQDWEGPGPFCSVSRDRCCLFLSQGDQGHLGSWVWIGVNDAEALARECRERGARIRQEPVNFPWAYEMQVQDPDGNVLRFGSDPRKGEPYGSFMDMEGRLWPVSGDTPICE